MTNPKKFYAELVSLSEGYKAKAVQEVKSLSVLLEKLVLTDLSDNTIDELEYKKRRKQFYSLFCTYDPKLIVREGSYLVWLNIVLEEFEPEHLAPYKAITKSVVTSARYLSRYKDMDEFKEYIDSSFDDVDSLISFIQNFRLKTSLSSMYFNKTCKFLSETGILDVPAINDDIRSYFFSHADVQDENIACFKYALEVALKNDVSCEEVIGRIRFALNNAAK